MPTWSRHGCARPFLLKGCFPPLNYWLKPASILLGFSRYFALCIIDIIIESKLIQKLLRTIRIWPWRDTTNWVDIVSILCICLVFLINLLDVLFDSLDFLHNFIVFLPFCLLLCMQCSYDLAKVIGIWLDKHLIFILIEFHHCKHVKLAHCFVLIEVKNRENHVSE